MNDEVKESNWVMPLAIFYTIIYIIALVVGLVMCIVGKINLLLYLIYSISSIPTLVVLWSLGGAIERIIKLEKRVLFLSENKKHNKKLTKNKISNDFGNNGVFEIIDTDGECISICPKCGYQIFADEDKCSNCGYKK